MLQSIKRIAIIYDSTFEYTTGFYCKRALSIMGFSVDYYTPDEVDSIPLMYDLYLNIDDNMRYLLPKYLKPSAYWAIDTHTDYEWRLKKARMFDFVFVAQKNGMQAFKRDGIENVVWLALACDQQIHKKCEAAKEYDISFVGNIHHSKRRIRYLSFLKKKLKDKKILIGQALPQETAMIYAKSKLVFNISVKDDINMRVFEVLSCGRPLLTNELYKNGQKELFGKKPPFIVYKSKRDLLRKIKYYLSHENESEEIARLGWQEAIGRHTYLHRVTEMIEVIEKRKNYIKYDDYKEDISVMDNIYGKAFDLIHDKARVLDIGCATGRFSKYLVSRKECFVTGIEKDHLLAKKAEGILQEVILGDIMQQETYEKIKHKYDFILLMDILEHTIEPGYILLRIKDFLEEKASVILTTPNIAYWAIRKNLLLGRFDYNPTGGLMDNEHIHFFTYYSIKKLIREGGYTIRHLDTLYSFPLFNSNHYLANKIIKIGWIRKTLERIAKKSPNFFAYQFLFVIGKSV